MPDSNQITAQKRGGKLLGRIRDQLIDFAQTAKSAEAIEAKAQELIKNTGGKPSFAMVPGYSWATCVNINDSIVHGVPKGRLQTGDLVTIDVGLFYEGFHTDASTSFVIGQADAQVKQFLSTGQKVLSQAINQARAGKKVKDISQIIQKKVEAAGYSVVRELTGHGVGKELHQEPSIPCFISADPALNTRLEAGMSLAVEVMYTMGDWPLKLDQDGWTLRTQDGSLSAVFEETIVVTDKKPFIVTKTN